MNTYNGEIINRILQKCSDKFSFFFLNWNHGQDYVGWEFLINRAKGWQDNRW